MTKQFFFIIICLICITTFSFSQNSVKGIVCREDSTSIPYANIILTSQDSILAKCINTSNGFILKKISPGNYILKISHIGYQTKEISLDVKNNIDLGNIILESGYNINEISITASRNTLSYEKGILKVAVKNTYLSSLSTMEDLLSNIPGLFFNDGELKYFAKGQPLILINGKEAKSETQINALQPSQIIEITVNNNPEAKYDPRYSAVIEIKTTPEKPALLIYNTESLGRHFSDIIGINSQLRIKKTIVDLSYRFRKRDNESYSIQQEESFQPDYYFKNIFTDTIFDRRLSHDWSANLYRKMKKHSISLEYTGYFSTNTPRYNSLMLSDKQIDNNDEQFVICQNGKYKEYQNILSLDYSFSINKKNLLRITTDYLLQTTKDKSHTAEISLTSEEQKQTITDFTGKYNLFSALAEYTHTLNHRIVFLAGSRYSYVHNNNRSQQNSIQTQHYLRENRYAAYMSGNFTWEKVALQVGLRGEKFDQQYIYDKEQDTNYKHLFFLTSFSLTVSPSKVIQLSLSGNKKLSLPSFNQLTTIKTYFNQYSYSIGNPLLKPSVTYNLEIRSTLYNKLNISIGYNQIKNDRIYKAEADLNDNHIIKYTYGNIDRTTRYTGMITYSDKLMKLHDISLSAGILFPNSKTPYHNSYIHYAKSAYFAQLYCNLKIGNIINFSIGYIYQSKSYEKASITTETHNLRCNLSIAPIKDKLFCALRINDILRKGGSNWQTNYGYFKTQQFNNYDNRNITFSIRYAFNSFKHIKRNISNEEEINRL